MILFAFGMSASRICLFHNPRYSSILHQIFNILRQTIVKDKCEVKRLVKKCVCTCPPPVGQAAISSRTDFDPEHLLKAIRSNFQKVDQQPEKLEEVLRTRVMLTCDDQMAIAQLLEFICEMSNRAVEIKERSVDVALAPAGSKQIRQCIELPLPLKELGHLLGRHGSHHKAIVSKTNTSIHFDNALYSDSSHDQSSEFHLERSLSLASVKATITGNSQEAVESAIAALNERTESVKAQLAQYSSTNCDNTM